MNQVRPQSRLMVLMFTDIVGSVDLKQRLGDATAGAMIRRHDELFRYTVGAFAYAEILKDLGDGFLARFTSASDAVHAALHFQNVLHNEQWKGERLTVRIGLHLGEVSELEIEAATGKAKVSGLAVDIAARVMGLALPGQILMTRAAFDNARQYVREHQSSDGDAPAITRKWMAHGRYMFKGAEEPLEVFEVGEMGIAPLAVPPDSDKARRSVAADQEETLGWRPAVGLEIPDRKHWVLDRKLGEGGFGEVWLGESVKTKTRRVFKFCFDAERLRSFKRELMLFRLLRDALGDRNDIAKLHEVQIEQAPFYLESEFTEDGSLVDWAKVQGGIDKIPLTTRLDIVARTAVAVAAAHSVGVLHKDIKPSNILIFRGPDGSPQPRLTDFGIGELTDPSQLANRNITMVGMTSSLVEGNESSRTGTRIYAPPEALVGKPFTIQGDVYALGIFLYQMVVADLDRPLAQGWERDVADPLLREDIGRCVEGHEDERLSSAKELADRLQTLPARRRARQRRKIARVGVAASIILAVLLSLSAVWLIRERRLRLETEAEAKKAVAISGFLTGMLTSVDPRENPTEGRNVKVVDKLDQAVVRLDGGQLVDAPEIDASVRWAIGNAYKAGGSYKEADEQLQKALQIRRATPGESPLELAQTLEDEGAAKWWLGDYVASESLEREALNIRKAAVGEHSKEYASSLNYLAAAVDSQGNHQEAERYYKEALDIRRALPITADLTREKQQELVARSINNLGTCLRSQGRLDEALSLSLEALKLIRELRGNEHIDVANGLTNVALCLVAQQKYDEAEKFYLESLPIKRKVHGDVHASVAATLQGLADVEALRGKLDDAEKYGKEALEVRRKVYPEGQALITASLDSLGNTLHALKKDAEAEPILKEALANKSKLLPQGHWAIAETTSRLGASICAQGRVEEGEPMMKWAYESLQQAHDDKNAARVSAAREAAGQALIKLYKDTNRPQLADAVTQSLAQLIPQKSATP